VIRSANQLVEGNTKSQVITELEKEGCSVELSQAIANKAVEIKQEALRKSGKSTLLLGAGLAGLGVAITAGTYSAATSGGGSYVVTYGLILVGGWLILKGLWRMIN
jgi:hypothetical protein